jgi:16S rRNA (guanine966-N2)-methyltransferase
LEFTHMNALAEVIFSDAFAYLKRSPDRKFEYIYVAPPQYKALWQKALVEIDANSGWLSEDAWIIVQIHPVEYEEIQFMRFSEFDQRRYGSTLLVFYEMKPGE